MLKSFFILLGLPTSTIVYVILTITPFSVTEQPSTCTVTYLHDAYKSFAPIKLLFRKVPATEELRGRGFQMTSRYKRDSGDERANPICRAN